MERFERSGTRLSRGRQVETSPSFSSSLLDAIYRSIDEGDGRIDTCKGGNRARNYGHEKDDLSYITTTTTRKCFATTVETKKQIATVVTEKVGHCCRGCETSCISEFDRRSFKLNQKEREKYVFNSTSSSSESSYGGFSSSEAESARVKSYGRQPPLPTQSERSTLELKKKHKQENQSTSNSIRNRFHESKIYNELKKGKAPISPGGRLASFINQLFNSASHSKKAKTSSPATTTVAVTGRGRGDDSTCSSASSYSRSNLSKTASSRTKTTSSGKRSVRFYPLSIILGDDLRPCGEKCVYDNHSYGYEKMDVTDPPLPPLPAVRVRHPVVEEEKKARDLIERSFNGKRVLGMGFEEDEGDDDDAASYSSSDLFELDNLTTIGGEMGGVGGGGERYSDELPVYETTHVHTNRAIAQGLVM